MSAAYELASDLMSGARDLDSIQKELTDQSKPLLTNRLMTMTERWQCLDRDTNVERLGAVVDRLANNPAGGLWPFEKFRALVEDEMAGFVVTAHPTFSMSGEAWRCASVFMNALSDGEQAAVAALKKESLERLHPERSPTLHEELEYANVALGNMRRSLRSLYHVVFARAAELYPEDYRALRPRMATIASWVGFDLDGRTDINWSLGLLFRYRTATAGLTLCHAAIDRLQITSEGTQEHLSTIRAGFSELANCFEKGENALAAYQDEGGSIAEFNKLTVENREVKEQARDNINKSLEALLSMDLADADWREVALLSTEWHSVGLGLSHIHFRLNAAQLHNAMGPEINLTRAPDQSAMRRHYLAAISEKLDTVKRQSIHYGILAAERTTAKRVFMMAAQFRKHFDATTRIRMLVAESDTPFTLLAALYYAKLFGVDDYVEISPLFETAVGLERGDRVIAELIDNPHFLDYIKRQGRFCLQLGFSDSGRYIGQPAASLAIERFKLRLIRLWKARGLGDIQLLFFDTHGESIGRGAFPGALKDRFVYTQPPRVRQALAELERPEKHEVSFQGGEGFLWFLSEETALATLTDFLEVRFAHHDADDDVLYEEKGWSLDFFLTLVEYQNQLTDDPGYIRLIDSIGRSLLYPTGSRSMRRQSGSVMHQRLERISQIRAIPHNAVLQQLGYLANSCAGLGTAIERAPDKFNAVFSGSERLRIITSMAINALARSDVGIIESYAKLLSPGYWLDRCDEAQSEGERSSLRRLSTVIEGLFDSDSIDACIRDLRRDAGMMTDCLEEDCDSAVLDIKGVDQELFALHEMRIGLIQFIFMKAMDVPRFSSRFDFSLEELLVELLHLEVPDTVARLREIFPEAISQENTSGYGEDVSYQGGQMSGYAEVHRTIFDQLDQAYELVLALSGLIALKAGAFG